MKPLPKRSRLAKAVCQGLICLSGVSASAQAAMLVVTSNGDSGGAGCELREAIEAISNGSNGGGCNNSTSPIEIPFGVNDFISFDANTLASRTISLQLGELEIDSSLTISGGNSLLEDPIVIDGQGNSRVMRISYVGVNLNNLTIMGGSTSGLGGGIFGEGPSISLSNSSVRDNQAGNGGGISLLFDSTISISNSSVTGNTATFSGGGLHAERSSKFSLLDSSVVGNSAGVGGGVFLYLSALELEQSLVSNNRATSTGGGVESFYYSFVSSTDSSITNNRSGRDGGGIRHIAYSSATFINSTVSSNQSSEDGGGISIGSDSTLNLTNSTVANNSAMESGGNLYSFTSLIEIQNSIVSNGGSAGDCAVPTGVLSVDSVSIIEDGSCNTNRAIDPMLGPLSDNGGTTLTHALLPDSPARNSGNLSTCTAEDQRGQLRDDGDGACDVGAIEFNPDDDFGEAETNFIVIPMPDGRAAVVPL